MAIRSNVLQEKVTTAPIPVLQMAFWIAGGVLASAAISGGRVPSVADVFLHLIIAAIVFSAMTLALSWVLHESIEEAFSRFGSVLPFAVGGAVIAAWTGIWNDGSGAIALPLGQQFLFFVTGGIAPLKLGPDAFLRFVTTFSVILVAYHLGESRVRQVRAAAASWIAGAIVLLIPSFAASILAMTRGVALATAQDALRLMGSALADSYWSNFQQERFLTGIGNQLGVMVGFWTAAITLIVGVCLVVSFAAAVHREDFRRVVGVAAQSLRSSTMAWAMGGAVVIGFLVASTNPMRSFQFVPIALCIISLAALAHHILFDQDAALFVGGFASALLGWPVVAAYLSCAALCIAAKQTSGARQIWMIGAAGAAFAVLGAAFGVRSSMFPPNLAAWAIPLGVLVAGTELVGQAERIGQMRMLAMRELVVFCGVLALCAIFMGFLPGIAVAALGGLAAFTMQKKADLWAKYAGFLLLLTGWAMMAFKLFVGQ